MTSYREAYATLSRIAAELESGEADVDRVLPLLEEARAAFETCRARLEAVRRALGDDWDEESDDDPDDEEEDTEGPV